MMTGKYLTTLEGNVLCTALGPNGTRIEANISRFEGLPFAFAEDLRRILCYAVLTGEQLPTFRSAGDCLSVVTMYHRTILEV